MSDRRSGRAKNCALLLATIAVGAVYFYVHLDGDGDDGAARCATLDDGAPRAPLSPSP